ncbi:MAG: tetratricopeptide repeat protein, partial [Myxococcales bacterium]|nr:tetratricopeptide repeat protein [Myxococcales bacterium]
EPAAEEPPSGAVVLDTDLPADAERAAELLARRAQASTEAREFAQAEARLSRALELDPRNHRVMAAYAEYYLARGMHEQAKSFAERALRRRGRRARYHVLMGDILRASGDAEGARASYRRAAEYDPDDRTARRRLQAMP